MALQDSSQSISLQDIRTEYIAGSTASISMGDLYRGGSIIRKPSPNNIATDLSPNIPDNPSNSIALTSFYNQEKGFRFTLDSSFRQSFGDSANDFSDSGTMATINLKTDIFGSDFDGNDYNMFIVIDSNSKITNNRRGGKYASQWPNLALAQQNTITIPSTRSGTLEITNNGEILNRGGTAIQNNSIGTGVTIKGTGKVYAVSRHEFISQGFRNSEDTINRQPAVPNGYPAAGFSDSNGIKWTLLGGQGGASGPDYRYNTSGFPQSDMNARVTRDSATGSVFTFEWTENELDYSNRGSGSKDASPIFPLNPDGTFNDMDSARLLVNTNGGSFGSDTRDIAFGSAWRSGVWGGITRDRRHFYGATNCKSSSLVLPSPGYPSGPDRYPQPGWHSKTFTHGETGNTTTKFVTQIHDGITFGGEIDKSQFTGDSGTSFAVNFDSLPS